MTDTVLHLTLERELVNLRHEVAELRAEIKQLRMALTRVDARAAIAIEDNAIRASWLEGHGD